MKAKITTIYNAKIVTEKNIIEKGRISFAQGKILAIEMDNSEVVISSGEMIDAKGGYILPGFIDVHIHGGAGSGFMDGSQEDFDKITSYHLAHGTTGLLATTVSASKESLDLALKNIYSYMNNAMSFSSILGIHLEGPFFNRKKAGGQDSRFFVPSNINWVNKWCEIYPNLLKIVSFAPELPGSLELIDVLKNNGIIAACGHTNASFTDMEEAAAKGLTHAIHTFNAMKEFHHREPGTVGAILSNDTISAEIIADGLHVHPACIKILAKLKSNNNLILITDCIPQAGLGDGTYYLGGHEINVENGQVRLSDGTLSGSTLTMIDGFRYLLEKVGLPIEAVSQMASLNPAKLLRIDHLVGSLVVGKQADILLLSKGFQIERIWVEGVSRNTNLPSK